MGIILFIFSIIVLVIILCSTIFSVANISLNFMSSTYFITESSNEILNNAKINETGSIFLVNKEKIIKNLQTYNTRIKVINIESIFPNKLKINAIEKEDFYAISCESGYVICDENLSTIYIKNDFTNTKDNAIILENLSYNSNFDLGMDLSSSDRNFVSQISYTLREWELNTNLLLGSIESIYLNYTKANQIKISMFTGTTILVENAHLNLSSKLNSVFSFYDNNLNSQFGGTIKVIDCEDGYSRLIFSE